MQALLIGFLGLSAAVLAGLVVALWSRQSSRGPAKAPVVTPPTRVDPAIAAELEAKVKSEFEAQITASTHVFGEDLKATSARLGEQVSRLTTTVIEEELTAYQQTLEEVRTTAVKAMEDIRAATEAQRKELREGLQADLTAERDRLIAKFDTKLGDVVSGYIAESLGGGVDLGAQMQFILKSLESHKDDIKKDLSSGL